MKIKNTHTLQLHTKERERERREKRDGFKASLRARNVYTQEDSSKFIFIVGGIIGESEPVSK